MRKWYCQHFGQLNIERDGDQMQILQNLIVFTVLTLLVHKIFSFQSQLFQSVPKLDNKEVYRFSVIFIVEKKYIKDYPSILETSFQVES